MVPHRVRSLMTCVALAALLACQDGGRRYEGRGIVREVEPELRQLVIEHEDIPGLMPAMTMNFDVADPKLLAQAKPGEAVDFEVSFDGRSYRITRLQPRESTPGAIPGSGPRLAEVAAGGDPAPDFHLVDQDQHPVTLASLRGFFVVLDFVYTTCPGPCPILTSSHVTLQRSLTPALRAHTRFISISLDPEKDTPQVLRRYGAARGVDFETWSFLTGPPAEVSDVLTRYGVGSVRQPDGTINHLVITFLIDADGQITQRYVGLEHDPDEIAGDLAKLLQASTEKSARTQ
ncbi:MAG TPA: SCO family protein [Myxococcota bacterium]|nr:SCO family protein [Myxococcota bacterium]